MARMFPKSGPQNTGSPKAEPDIYWRLSKQLSDEFTVIHSLPWLASAAREIDGRFVPTGEIDFLILHQELGILAVEVKGGILIHDRTEFVYKKTGQRIDPVRQIRRGSHALSEWLHQSGCGNWRIGYCIIFPNSEMGNSVPVALIDRTINPHQPIVLDIKSLDTLGEKIQEIMEYWKKALNTWSIKNHQIEKLVNILLPSEDYTPCWQTRINNDNITWLRLTEEQSDCLRRIEKSERLVVTGFPGTGKTLLLIEYARRLADQGKTVLILTYNSLLTKRLSDDLSSSNIKVSTFHEQCRRATNLLNDPMDLDNYFYENTEEWYSSTGPALLKQAVAENKLAKDDLLIVDEGQALHIDWWNTLCEWFSDKQIIAFCDATQSFAFENSTSADEIGDSIGAESPLTLTVNLRSPRSVFDRIIKVKSSNYQQSCPRNFEPDTLTEILTRDPENALQKVIHDLLNKDKISTESIVIIDVSPGFTLCKPYSRPLLRDRKQYLNIPIFSAAKFRGLESPVVVIYAGNTRDESALFCAYTRATSRCIVIYDAIFVSKGKYGKFGKILVEEKPDEIIQTEEMVQEKAIPRLTSEIFDEQKFNLLPIDSQSVDLYWCTDWNGWIIYPKHNSYVAQLMWTYHLTTTTDYSVYTWDVNEKWSVKLITKINNFDKNLKRQVCSLSFCKSCGLTTPHLYKKGREVNECILCLTAKLEFNGRDIEVQSKFSRILDNGSQAQLEDKKKLSIFLIAIGRWNKLVREKGNLHLSLYAPVTSGSVGYQVAHLLVLIEILIEKNEILKADDLMNLYIGWCPTLVQQVDRDKLTSFFSQALNTWFSKKVLRKPETGKSEKGIYERSIDFEEKIHFLIEKDQ
jgi:hypothetical protein